MNTNFTYYNRLTSDKYANLSLPSTTGFSSIKNNNGKFRNSGVEIELSGKILKTKDWSWDLGGKHIVQ
ncbi:TonB-dependent receptor [Bacteroides fragilis]|nr:TonB-dependent receptor [Bacteroides fragilis]